MAPCADGTSSPLDLSNCELVERRGAVARHIRVRGVPRPEPDVRLYVLALIELARQIQAQGVGKVGLAG